MGGIGAERFQIEETATNLGILTHAVVVKQSVKEALTLIYMMITKELAAPKITSPKVKSRICSALHDVHFSTVLASRITFFLRQNI